LFLFYPNLKKMEERKQKEINYYNNEVGKLEEGELKESGSRGEFSPFLLESYIFLNSLFKKRGRNKKILDYGCGTGINLGWLAKIGKEVIGIDLSEDSLELAKKRIEKEKLGNKAKVLFMDCEKTEFPDNSFDVVFDGGTFSSLDLNKILPELKRVLTPEGIVIGIETLGHNPFTNFKRFINKKTGKRTVWAAEHIFRVEDLQEVKRYFGEIQAYYFHLISWLVFPLLELPGARFILKLFEKIDKFLLFIFPFLKRYCFKMVFVFSGPRK